MITILPTAINNNNNPESFKAEQANRAVNPHSSIEEWDDLKERLTVVRRMTHKLTDEVNGLKKELDSESCPIQRLFLNERLRASRNLYTRYDSTRLELSLLLEAEEEG